MKLLLVDDDLLICSAVSRTLIRLGHSSRTATSVAEALSLVDAEDPSAILTDLDLGPGGDGISLLAELRRRGDRRPALLMTGSDLPTARARLAAAGLEDVSILAKPFEVDELLGALGALGPRVITGLPRERTSAPMASLVGNVMRVLGGRVV